MAGSAFDMALWRAGAKLEGPRPPCPPGACLDPLHAQDCPGRVWEERVEARAQRLAARLLVLAAAEDAKEGG